MTAYLAGAGLGKLSRELARVLLALRLLRDGVRAGEVGAALVAADIALGEASYLDEKGVECDRDGWIVNGARLTRGPLLTPVRPSSSGATSSAIGALASPTLTPAALIVRSNPRAPGGRGSGATRKRALGYVVEKGGR